MKKEFHNKKISNPKTSAFILVETLVAVSIILMVVPAVLGMTTKGITLWVQTKNQLIASYLSEEGLEYIRERRDENLMRIDAGEATTWDAGFYGPSRLCEGGCTVNPKATPPIASCSGCTINTAPPSAAYRLYADSATGYYSHSGAPADKTIFYRSVTVAPSGTIDELVITSVVAWQAGFGMKSIKLNAYITRWIQ